MVFKCIVNGNLIESKTGRVYEVRNPANTKEIVGRVPLLSGEEVEQAIVSAHRAFKEWSTTPPAKRAEIIKKGVEIARKKLEEIARLLTLENGKTLKEAKEEVKASLDSIEYFAEGALRILGETYPTNSENRLSIVVKQPVGVVSAIVPWNYPLLLLAWKIGPALTTGCTVVAKPAHVTPLSTLKMAECFLEAGLPAGVLNIVTGDAREIGKVLLTHPLIAKIAFTGSTNTGRMIMKEAADTVKRLTLELGGNCPLVVFEDADLKEAVKGAVRRAFRNAGQVCNAINRIYVHRSIYKDFLDLFLEETKKIRVGNGLREDVDMGPLTTEEGWKRVKEYVEEAVAKGAKILYGGKNQRVKNTKRAISSSPRFLLIQITQ